MKILMKMIIWVVSYELIHDIALSYYKLTDYVGMLMGQDYAGNLELVYFNFFSKYILNFILFSALHTHRKLNYLFEVNEKEIIDSAYIGNFTRFLNHGNNPNCVVRSTWTSDVI